MNMIQIFFNKFIYFSFNINFIMIYCERNKLRKKQKKIKVKKIQKMMTHIMIVEKKEEKI